MELSAANALNLRWSFGFNKDLCGGVHHLGDETTGANSVFYVAAHTGIIYDYAHRKQRLLQGHCNPITASCVSFDKRWIATADAGPDSLIVLWDSVSGRPIKDIPNPHKNGVIAMDMSPDAMFLVTMSFVEEGGEEKQEIALWEWTVDREGPLYTAVCETRDVQHCVRFNVSDIREIVSNGDKRTIFWNWESKEFKYYSPPVSKSDFRQAIGRYTQSTFIPDSSQAITATVDGDVILWDRSLVGIDEGFGDARDKKAVKVIRLCNEGAIRYVNVIDNMVVAGSDDGAVRFYDFQMRLLSWFEDINAGPVTSVSFSSTKPPPAADPDLFQCPDFVVGTAKSLIVGMNSSLFDKIRAEDRRGVLLVQGFDAPVHACAAHLKLPYIAVAADSGTVQLWDYEEKRLMMVRVFDGKSKGGGGDDDEGRRSENVKLVPRCMAFDPEGNTLAIACKSGALKLVEGTKLGNLKTKPDLFRNSESSINHLAFSPDGRFLASADDDYCVALYRYMTERPLVLNGVATTVNEDDDEIKGEGWVYIGKYRSHSAKITSLQFGLSFDGEPRLVSVALDRTMVEYNLSSSNVAEGVKLEGEPKLIEQDAMPGACMWYPSIAGNKEELLVTSNDQYKLKFWNANQKNNRRTVLGPTYGGPLSSMLVVKGRGSSSSGGMYAAYATERKVIGLIKLPLDGNPHRTMGLVAHPSEICSMVASADGAWLMSAGGKDMTVNLWAINTDVLDAAVASGGRGVAPYAELIEGGSKGEFYQEMVDFFYFAQLRSQGEGATESREASGKVPIVEIPNLMRALGYYPTQTEILNMCSEVKYSQFAETGQQVDSVTFEQFLKLYVNHRPIWGYSKDEVEGAFREMGAEKRGAEEKEQDGGEEAISIRRFVKLLERKGLGEEMDDAELQRCLQTLLGTEEYEEFLRRTSIGADSFMEMILGMGGEDED